MKMDNALRVEDRATWREWLSKNYDKEKEVWLVYAKKHTGKPRILYNDAVEEALCFGWIDSTVKRIDEDYYAQRFSPRNQKAHIHKPTKRDLQNWLSKTKSYHRY